MPRKRKPKIHPILKLQDEILQGPLSPFGVVQSNTCFELLFQRLIEKKLKHPERIDLTVLRMPTLIELAVALGAIEHTESQAFKKFNSMRNEIAHGVEMDLSRELPDLVNTFGGRVKMLHKHFSGSISHRNTPLSVAIHSMHQFLLKQFLELQEMDGWHGFIGELEDQ